MARILMVATALGTVNLAKGVIVHADPSNPDPRARWIYVNDEASAVRLEQAEIARVGTEEDEAQAAEELAAGVNGSHDEEGAETVPSNLDERRSPTAAKAGKAPKSTTGGRRRAAGKAGKAGKEAPAPKQSPATKEAGTEVDEDVDAAPGSGTKAASDQSTGNSAADGE